MTRTKVYVATRNYPDGTTEILGVRRTMASAIKRCDDHLEQEAIRRSDFHPEGEAQWARVGGNASGTLGFLWISPFILLD